MTFPQDLTDFESTSNLSTNQTAPFKWSVSATHPYHQIPFILGSVAVVVNVITILAIYQMRTHMTPHIRLLLNLTVADFLIAVIVILDEGISLILLSTNQTDHISCLTLVVDCVYQMAHILTLLTLTLLALDLYMAIVHPLTYRVSTTYEERIGRVICLVWFIAAILGFTQFYLPSIPLHKSDGNNTIDYCSSHWDYNHLQSECFILAVLAVSIVIMIFTYGAIFWHTQRFLRQTSTRSYATTSTTTSTTTTGSSSGAAASTLRQSSTSTRRDTTGIRGSFHSMHHSVLRMCLMIGRRVGQTCLSCFSCHSGGTQFHEETSVVVVEESSSMVPLSHPITASSSTSNCEEGPLAAPAVPSVTTATGLYSHVPLTTHFSTSVDAQKRQFRRKLRCLITTLTIVGVFLLCFLPYFGLQMYDYIYTQTTEGLAHIPSRLAARYLRNLLLINSILDPLIYCLRLNDVRVGYARLFRWCRRRERPFEKTSLRFLHRQKSFSCGHLNYLGVGQHRHPAVTNRPGKNHLVAARVSSAAHRGQSSIRYGFPAALRTQPETATGSLLQEQLANTSSNLNTLNFAHTSIHGRGMNKMTRSSSAPDCSLQSNSDVSSPYYSFGQYLQPGCTEVMLCKAILGIGHSMCCTLLHPSLAYPDSHSNKRRNAWHQTAKSQSLCHPAGGGCTGCPLLHQDAIVLTSPCELKRWAFHGSRTPMRRSNYKALN